MGSAPNSRKVEKQEQNTDKGDRRARNGKKAQIVTAVPSNYATLASYYPPEPSENHAARHSGPQLEPDGKNSLKIVTMPGDEIHKQIPSLPNHKSQQDYEYDLVVLDPSTDEQGILESIVTGPRSYTNQPHLTIEAYPQIQEIDVNIPVIMPLQMGIPALLKQVRPLPTEDGEGVIEAAQIERATEELQAIEDFRQYLPHITDPMHYMQIMEAYVLASYAHRHQRRKSGEPYITHPIEVARVLAELHMDCDTLVASLLHDVVEDTDFDLEYIDTHFGTTVATLVDGVTKLKRIKQLSNSGKNISDTKAESLRKMFLAMVDDVRIVLIKLADRQHNMRTLKGQDSGKRERIARETLDIFAPLANRLGIWQIKWELEDLSFRYINPNAYKRLAKAVQQKRTAREEWVEEIIATLQENLQKQGIKATVTGRPKHIYSIWRKMNRKDVGFDQIYDVHGFRIMVEDITQCYAALGVVHGLWRPIHGEFDDYIANPKDNMYRSLHTAVHSRSDDANKDGHPMEIQIRTHEMHEFAELGIAAHWRYKEQTKFDQSLENKIQWLRSLMDWGQEVSDPDEFVDTMKSDVFQDRVYVFSPQGEVFDLPTGATPIDFAYSVHTELGHRCRGAKVDGRIVPLDYKLQTGEQVHVLPAKRGGPSRDWLNPNLEYVKTQRAKSKIRVWLRQQNRDENILIGRRLLEKEMKRLAVTSRFEAIAELFNYEKVDDFFIAIGCGTINSQQIAKRIIEEERQSQTETELEIAIDGGSVDSGPRTTTGSLQVQGLDGLLTHLGRCCNPLPGDEIMGYVTRGRGVTVHRKDCSNAAATKRRGRDTQFLDVQWKKVLDQTYPVKIQIHAYDRAGLINDVTNVVRNEKINILNFEAITGQENNLASIKATLEIVDVVHLTRILTKVDQLPNVVDVHRSRS